MTRQHSSRLALNLVLVALVTLGACGGQDSRPSVIVIVMDTLRADHLGCYGYERQTSPRIDAFAAEATFYERAYATAPWTVPTHASLFTGQLPFEHGAHTHKTEQGEVVVAPLDLDHLTLAEVFQAAGYRTGGFVAGNVFLSERFQFNQGFATYRLDDHDARGMTRQVIDWLDTAPGDPFFVFINYMDTHRIYNTAPRPGFIDPPAVRDQGQLLDALYEQVMPGDRPVPQDIAAKVIDQYDTAVANLDEQIGVLLDALRERGLYDDTIVVLTADHGEYFGEHHLVEHSKDVYEEAVRAPLVIKPLGPTQGRRVERPHSLADVPSLIFAQLPAAFAADQRAGFLRDAAADPIIVENYFTRRKDFDNPLWGKRFDRIRTAIYGWPFKYIESSDGQHELYRLDVDPGEARNLVADEPDRAAVMAERLASFKRERAAYGKPVRPQALTPEERKRLKSLGYLGN